MGYSLEQLASDCQAALVADNGPGGREKIRECISRACADPDFVAVHLGPDMDKERHVLYEDTELGFCILGHVYTGAKHSDPHDHGPSWAIYGQAKGETEMTEWKVLKKPSNGEAGVVEKARSYRMSPGDAYLYHIGDVHSPSRDGETRLLRVEGMNMDNVTRDKFVIAA
jgi:hypothetical protein